VTTQIVSTGWAKFLPTPSIATSWTSQSLLMARPFAVGNHIRVRSGALGSEFYGTVTSMSLTYVSVPTDQGMLKVPNSSVLAAAPGPWDRGASGS
jgi:small-conductance mechanosensitive channel